MGLIKFQIGSFIISPSIIGSDSRKVISISGRTSLKFTCPKEFKKIKHKI